MYGVCVVMCVVHVCVKVHGTRMGGYKGMMMSAMQEYTPATRSFCIWLVCTTLHTKCCGAVL